jgi:ribosomal protein S16
MLKLRLKRIEERVSSISFSCMENTYRRDGRPVEEVGYLIPFRKESHFEIHQNG